MGGLIGALLPTDFSVAEYWLNPSDLRNPALNFKMPNYSIYLTAVIKANEYTGVFNWNGNTAWSMDDIHMIYDQLQMLPPNKFEKSGYAFIWWSRTAIWEPEFGDQEWVDKLTTGTGEVVLYAQRGILVPYIINYYHQNLIWDDYYLAETGIAYWVSGAQAPPVSGTYTWFTATWEVVDTITSGGSISYYYDRNVYHLVVKDRDAILVDTWIKYGKDIPLPADPTWWTGNTFSGWYSWDVQYVSGSTMPAYDLVITSIWQYGTYTITFITHWWTEIAPISLNYGKTITPPPNPTREWYTFEKWSPDIPATMPNHNMTINAVWKKVDSGWWWSSGWWRWKSWTTWDQSWTTTWDKSETPEESVEDQHGAASSVDQISRDSEGKVSMEAFIAYMWARNKWIISTSRKDSDPDGYIPRWDMAEMVVKFTENVLWRKIPPIIPVDCHWSDARSEWKSAETKVYAEKACALRVMWIRMEYFMPNKYIDRAEFWTILSRLLWWNKYDVVNATKTNAYYTKHLQALNLAGIMKQVDNPVSRMELRKWAWLMMMRVKS